MSQIVTMSSQEVGIIYAGYIHVYFIDKAVCTLSHFDEFLCEFKNLLFYPGLFSKDIKRLEGIPQISSTADHYPAPHKGHLTGKGEDLQPLFSSFNHYGGLSMVQRRQLNNPIVQTAVDPGKQVYLFINNLNLTDQGSFQS